MKKQAILTGLFLLILCGTSCTNGKKIFGNRTVVTREIPVDDFLGIEIAATGMEFVYEQKPDSAPYFCITTDENILAHLQIEVKNGMLVVRPKEENVSLHPFVLRMQAHSGTLTKISKAGSGNININSPLTVSGKLEINTLGSGEINLNDSTVVPEMAISGAGNTAFTALHLRCIDFTDKGSGATKATLGGWIKNGSFSLMGRGTVEAFNCCFDELSCNIAGNGDMEVTVNRLLDVKIAGKGTVRYRGNPEIRQQITGKGRIEQIHE